MTLLWGLIVRDANISRCVKLVRRTTCPELQHDMVALL